MGCRQSRIALGMVALLVDRFRRKIPLHDGRGAHHQSPRGHILCDDRSSGDQSTCTDGDAIQNDGTNPHQAPILQRGAMDHGSVTNGDVDTDTHRLSRIAMEHGTVLNIAARSDADLLEISARNGRCLLYTSPSPRDRTRSRMPSSA